ncbi:alpha/beta fold hydrolase [Rubellimicrobium sp. CFH 75288]|nr:alpha/beta hydrolase [Rubellimicrobium sp. CFH 75288]NAZ35492.1 alpha/beta fold hydrolase [Rubellimicrobium sp. CFH 75288]
MAAPDASPAAPFRADLAEGPPGACPALIAADDGVRLRAVHWSPPAPRGTVLLFSGRTEYCEKYGRVAADLWRAGWAVLTIDWRGQGLSARLRPGRALGHVGRFADYQRDVAALTGHARRLGLPEPWVLLAHSMGGAIGLRALMEGLPVRAAAFSAPMWGIRMRGAVRPFAWSLSATARRVGLGHVLAPGQAAASYVLVAPFEGNALTGDRDHWDYMRRQVEAEPDLALGGPSLHWLNEALLEMRALARCPSPAVPALGLVGSEEAVVEPRRIRARFARWEGGRLIEMEGARHEILMERPAIREPALAAILGLFASVR